MNADGFNLLARVKQGEDGLVAQIDRCAYYARTKRAIEVAEFRKLAGKDKISAEVAMVHLLCRILGETF